jgi:CubicO group peptidase (beta-lactamase class C family)
MRKNARPALAVLLTTLVGGSAVAASGASTGGAVLCLPSSTNPSNGRTITVPWSVAWYYLIRGATLGPCPTCDARRPGLTCDESTALAEHEEQLSEASEDLAARVIPDTGDPLPIAPNAKPPDPRLMGACIDEAYAGEAEVGYSWAIARDGALGASGAGGWARAPWEAVSPSVPMAADRRMTIASVSKTITAVAVMKLIEETPGLDLDDPFYPLVEDQFSGLFFDVEGVLVDIPGPGLETVTLRNLLTHRSGLTPGLGCGKLTQILGLGVVGTPGTTYDYENSNYCILREVVESVSGQSYQSYVLANVLTPMGITEMSCEVEDTDPTLYYNTILNPGTSWGDFASCSAYGWYASAVDLVRFLVHFRLDTVLSDASAQRMLQECPDPGGTSGYCLGWQRSTGGAIGTHHWHSGDFFKKYCGGDCNKGVNSTMMRLPQGIDAAVLVNTRAGNAPNPGLKSEVTILRDCYAEAFQAANGGGRR